MVDYIMWASWAIVRAAQSDINEDLHAAELKYTVLNVMVLIVAACLLGLISNLSTILSNNSTQTMTCLGYIWSDQNSYLWIIDSGLGIFIYLNDWSLI